VAYWIELPGVAIGWIAVWRNAILSIVVFYSELQSYCAPRKRGEAVVDRRYHFWYISERPGMKRLPAAFHALPSGREPVREWIRSLDRDDRKIVGEDVKNVEFSRPIGMPLCRPLGNGLWEVRSSLARGRIARIIFCIGDGPWSCCTLSSRRRRKRRRRTWRWPFGA